MADKTVKVALTMDERGYIEGLRRAEKQTKTTTDEAKGHLSSLGGHTGGILSKLTGEVGTFASGIAGGIGIGAVGGVAAFGLASIHMADQFDAAHARLQVALKNTHTNLAGFQQGLDKATQQGVKFGFNAAEIQDALAAMTTGMGDGRKALSNLTLAEDVHAASGKSLQESAIAITRAMEGNLRPLKALGIDLPIAATNAAKLQAAQDNLTKAQQKFTQVQDAIHAHMLKGPAALKAYAAAQQGVEDAQKKVNVAQATGGEILAALGQRLHGQASAQSNTFEGHMKSLHASLQNLQIQFGEKLEPVIEKLINFIANTAIPVVMKVVDWFQQHKAVAIALGLAIAYVISPIGLLVGALIYAYTHFKWFRDAVQDVVTFVRNGITNFVNTVQNLWQRFGQTILIYAKAAWSGIRNIVVGFINEIRAIIQIVTALIHGDWGQAWDGIKNLFHAVWQQILGTIQLIIGQIKFILSAAWDAIGGTVRSAWGNVLGFFQGLPGKIWGFFSGLPGQFWGLGSDIINAIANGIRAAGNVVLGALKGVVAPLHHIPGVDQALSAIGLATGGPVQPGRPYIVGENGPELFVSSIGGQIIPNNRLASVSSGGTPIGGGMVVNVAVNGPVLGANAQYNDQLARSIVNQLIQFQGRHGLAWQARA